MHELQVTQSILDTVLQAARANGLGRVARIHLVIGELNELRQEWIQRYFDYLSEGSAAQGAQILVEEIPAAFGCQDCGREFPVQMSVVEALRCPGCRGKNLRLTRGREFLIRDMEGQ
jgi:hydrogenase nickel incorporation protein HypA/HybF